MGNSIKVACIQLNSGPDISKNCEVAEAYIRQAAKQGARLVITPEVTDQVISNRAEKLEHALTAEQHPALAHFKKCAAELGIHLVLGSICIKLEDQKIANRCYHLGPSGDVVAFYDKIHLYDVDLPTGEAHRESALFRGGTRAALTQAEGANIGLSICYDLRFPYLYRHYAQAGADILLVPAAFTVPTGQAHWETLLRARAIENGAFVLAPAQCGDHQGARQTYGHSMIIDPWGKVLAVKDDGTGVLCADLNLDDVQKSRHAIPALKHDKEFEK